jgi:hypothetical protein
VLLINIPPWIFDTYIYHFARNGTIFIVRPVVSFRQAQYTQEMKYLLHLYYEEYSRMNHERNRRLPLSFPNKEFCIIGLHALFMRNFYCFIFQHFHMLRPCIILFCIELSMALNKLSATQDPFLTSECCSADIVSINFLPEQSTISTNLTLTCTLIAINDRKMGMSSP